MAILRRNPFCGCGGGGGPLKRSRESESPGCCDLGFGALFGFLLVLCLFGCLSALFVGFVLVWFVFVLLVFWYGLICFDIVRFVFLLSWFHFVFFVCKCACVCVCLCMYEHFFRFVFPIILMFYSFIALSRCQV